LHLDTLWGTGWNLNVTSPGTNEFPNQLNQSNDFFYRFIIVNKAKQHFPSKGLYLLLHIFFSENPYSCLHSIHVSIEGLTEKTLFLF
jgi:hypothetical protein